MYHPNWPCDVDIHFRFPGMEADTSLCFEVMWRSIDHAQVGGHNIAVPNRPLAVCLLALHALRTPWLPQSQAELEYLSKLDFSKEREEIEGIAKATGAQAALDPFFVKLRWQHNPDSLPRVSEEWKRRTLSRSPGSARILSLSSASVGRWPAIIFRAAFPSQETLLASDIYADLSMLGRCRLHATRWSTFARSLPQLAEDLRTAVRGTNGKGRCRI
jgi:hypothetical protein